MSPHEEAAIALISRTWAGIWVPVTNYVPGHTYHWADPETETTGLCRRGQAKWTWAPKGKAPVVLEWRGCCVRTESSSEWS